ncbi:MAG TPA: hypothetical protein VGE22_14345 [Solimonas sp.]
MAPLPCASICGNAAWQHHRGGEQRAAHLGLDLRRFVVLEGLGPDGAADVVDQDVETAEALDRRAHHALAVAGLFQVGSQAQHAFMLGQLEHQLGAVHRHHLRALLQQPLGDAAADALGGAGDHGDFVLETLVHLSTSIKWCDRSPDAIRGWFVDFPRISSGLRLLI